MDLLSFQSLFLSIEREDQQEKSLMAKVIHFAAQGESKEFYKFLEKLFPLANHKPAKRSKADFLKRYKGGF